MYKFSLFGANAPNTPSHESRRLSENKGGIVIVKNKRIDVRLSEKDYETLLAKANKAGLSVSEFIRQLIGGVKIKEAPTADVGKLIWEVRRVGININQILTTANASGFVDVPELRRAIEKNRELEMLITNAYTTKV